MTLRPARGLLTVRPVTTAETFAGGRIILTENERNAWAQWQMEVVAVGALSICKKHRKCSRAHLYYSTKGERAEDMIAEHLHDHRIRAGAWVIIRPRSIVETGGEEKLYLVKQEDCLGIFTLAESVGQ